MDVFLFLIGFVFLISGSNYLITGSINLAYYLKASVFFVGLIVVAFGTSLPEFIVSFFSTINKGDNSLAIANIIGSNIANVFLVLASSMIIINIYIKISDVKKNIYAFVLSTFLLILFLYIPFGEPVSISRWEGGALLVLFVIFLYSSFSFFDTEEESPDEKHSLIKIIIYIISGLICMLIGGHLIVSRAPIIASVLGIPESFVNLVLVALGTSLPELVVSIVSALRKHTDLLFANILGSNIFNIFFVLGANYVIKELHYSGDIFSNSVFLFLSVFFVSSFLFFSKKNVFNRYEGCLLLFFYIFYVLYSAKLINFI